MAIFKTTISIANNFILLQEFEEGENKRGQVLGIGLEVLEIISP